MVPCEVVPGVFRIELPLPFELEHINTYLAPLERGWMLIDCGLASDACREGLEAALHSLGIAWTDIRQVFLTHMHPDHSGLASEVLARSGARLLMHAGEAWLLAEVSSGEYHKWEGVVLAEAGVPPDLAERIVEAFAGIRKTFRKLDPDWPLAGGETIPSALGPLEVLWVRGHSPGHVCLYAAERRLLFAGDQMLEGITPNIGWQSDHDALGEYLASLDRLAALDIDVVLPSHGAPFGEHREWIRQTRSHHQERCRQIEQALAGAGAGKTAHELVADVWPRALSPFHLRFAVFEILAHLDFLKQAGRLRSRHSGGALRWSLGYNKTSL
ncbi:MAG: MBL fold metallo-hydrolase [Bryobacteraceae bacterium]